MIELQTCRTVAKGIILIASLTACSGGDTKAAAAVADSGTAAASTEGSTSGATTAAAPVTLSAADFDGFEKGIVREAELVREATQRAANAATPKERGEAIQAGFEDNTMAAAASVTGLSAERYKLVRETLSRIMTTLDFQGKIDGPQSVDTAHADAATKARLSSDPYAELDAASAAELKSRLSRIAPLWIAYANLTALNG